MKIMTILFLTVLSTSAHAFISDADIGLRLHELFCATPEASFAEAALKRNPNLTERELKEMLSMKSFLIGSLKNAGATAAKFDRHRQQFVAVFEMLESRDMSAAKYQLVRESEIGQAYVGCQTAGMMRARLQRVGCAEAELTPKALKSTLSVCESMMSKTKAMARETVEK